MQRRFWKLSVLSILTVLFIFPICSNECMGLTSGPPTIDTPTYGSVTAVTATLGATIESDGGSTITASGIVYGMAANPDVTGKKVSRGATDGPFTVDVSGLIPNTTYHFRAYAMNAQGTSYTEDATFTTPNGVIYGWQRHEIPGDTNWSAIASSSDGTRLVAASKYIYTSGDSGATWTQRTSAGDRSWSGVASSSDGSKLVAVDSGGDSGGGYIYTSIDFGATWDQQTSVGSRPWKAVASSSDGTRLIAAAAPGYIYTSTDSGATWIRQINAGDRNWQAVVSSSDGTRLIAADWDGYIYISINSGAIWAENTTVDNRQWRAVATSSNGTRLVAAEWDGYIYTSLESGASWVKQTITGGRYWQAVASSSDGMKLVALENDLYDNVGYIHTSTDFGVTWTQNAGSEFRLWSSVASSSDGTRLVAAESSGCIYTSTDSGATWIQRTSFGSHSWQAAASSSDAAKIVVADAISDSGGYIYTSIDSGATWVQQTGPTKRNFDVVVSSSDGTKLVALESDKGPYGLEYINTSTDSGASWTARKSMSHLSSSWTAAASSSDGKNLIAVLTRYQIYRSADFGATWKNYPESVIVNGDSHAVMHLSSVATSSDGTKVFITESGNPPDGLSTSPFPSYVYKSVNSGAEGGWSRLTNTATQGWIAVACSSDGTKLVAAENGWDTNAGYIYTSSDSGATWTKQTSSGRRNWKAVASSSDGVTLVAAVKEGYVYISADSGATWTPQTSLGMQDWRALALSSDGSKLTAVSDCIYTGTFLLFPTIDTPTASAVTTTSATLGATIEYSGATPVLAAGVAYGLNENPDITGSRVDSGVTAGSFKVDVTGLAPNTLYHFRGYATNSEGTSYSDDSSITSIADAPGATAATGLSSSGFTANWTAPSGTAAITGYFLDVAADSGFTIFIPGYTNLSVTGNSHAVTGLNPATAYWYRVRAVNAGGTSTSSSSIAISTLAAPSISSPSSSSITMTTATLGATITSDGGSTITDSGIAYGTGANPNITGNKAATSPTVTGGAFTVAVSGLTGNTVYHFRGYATNSEVTGYSGDSTFTTIANAPTAASATGVTSNSFSVNWTAPSGTALISGYRLDVSIDPNFTLFVSGYNDLLVSGTTLTVTGLSAGGTYYYRVRAVNAGGTSSNSNTITTVLPAPSLITIASPGGGESWKAGSKQVIRWTYTGTPGSKVRIELLKSGSVAATIASNVSTGKSGSGSYAWTLKSTLANGSDYQVRVTSTTNSSYTGTSKSYFSVVGSTVSLISPNGGETWTAGAKGVIKWNYTGSQGNIKIELLKSGVATTIKPSVSAGKNGTGSYKWTISKKQAAGSDYKIRVTSTTKPSCTDTSENDFSIAGVQAAAGPDQKAKASAVVRLTGLNSTGVKEESASFKWTQTAGPKVELSDPHAAETVFLAPESDTEGASLGFQLTVTNSDGAQSEDSCIVNVSENLAAPVAEAGPNQIVLTAQIVELDGSGSSASGAIVFYNWRQVSGVPVMLTDASAMQTTFVAPDVGAAGESLVLELTVTDQAGLRARDTCIVNVISNDKPPVANAGLSRTVPAASEVLLDGSGSTDTDNGIASYRWRQISGKPVVLAAPTGMKTAFVAPDIDSVKEGLVFELTVTDTAGLRDKSKVVITVVPATGGAGKK